MVMAIAMKRTRKGFMHPSDIQVAREKRADVAGSAGAGILGIGLGILLGQFARPELAKGLAFAFLLIGISFHGWGMYEKRRLEAGVTIPAWSKALYWLCWAAIVILAAWIGLAAL
jgi:hypothetical protein